MRRQRRVKIVATLGPASNRRETIEPLFLAGADVFRINMSHTTHDILSDLVGIIRDVETAHGRPIGIMVDLQGPKLRIGSFAAGAVELQKGDEFRLDSDPTPGDLTRVCLPHPEILAAAAAGDRLLLNDGRLKLEITAKNQDHVIARVEIGGQLSDRKGVSLPDTEIPISAMTEKDKADLNAGLRADADWIALSFVQRADDVRQASAIINGRAGIIAKIEKPMAIDGLRDIVEESDALMIARGDLGVEMPLERVPGLQKKIIRAARATGKPVVVATQMLESMISEAVPTRAEVSDVAGAVYEGADAVMLSAESAAGNYPSEAVAMMDRIAIEVEQDKYYRQIVHAQRTEPEPTTADAISAAARQIADTLDLAAIVCYTRSGATGIRAARERPARPIIALSPIMATVRRLSLIWGVHCVASEDAKDVTDMVERAVRIAHQEQIAKPDERIIITAGVPFGNPGRTNMVQIAEVGLPS